MSEVLNKEGFLVRVDIEKAFDFVNHLFLMWKNRFWDWVYWMVKSINK